MKNFNKKIMIQNNKITNFNMKMKLKHGIMIYFAK